MLLAKEHEPSTTYLSVQGHRKQDRKRHKDICSYLKMEVKPARGKFRDRYLRFLLFGNFPALTVIYVHIYSSPITRNGTSYFGKNENDPFSFFSGKEGVSQAEWNSFRMGEIRM
jgi:hypothetical protein